MDDRPILKAVAKAMITSQALQCVRWCIEVLPSRSYNKIIVTYPADTVFLMKAHLMPIWKNDPGLLESPSVEYINDIWSEFKNNYTNLVCCVEKRASKGPKPALSLGNNNNGEGVEVFDNHGNYVYDHKTKKRKL